MRRGHLDAITSTGHVEGWAFDGDDPLRVLDIGVRAGEAAQREVASGLANLYRWDLAEAGYGTGWCAFRLLLSGDPRALSTETLSLWDRPAQAEIHQTATIAVRGGAEASISSLEMIRLSDPTLVHAVEQLRGCGAIFAAFIDAAGIEAFVRTAYLYMLARPADATGLAFYAGRLREEAMVPYDVLSALAENEEFRAGPGLLPAPPEPGFPFRAP